MPSQTHWFYSLLVYSGLALFDCCISKVTKKLFDNSYELIERTRLTYNCDLCNVQQEDKLWEENGFFGLVCNRCNVPMIVSCDHKSKLTKKEKEICEDLWRKHFPKLTPRGIGMHSSPLHWHEHAV